jgi:hypothetical protein
MSTRPRTVAIAACAVMLLTAYVFWAPKGMSRPASSGNKDCVAEISPKGTYRIETCRPAFPYISFGKSMARFVRFYDQRTQQLLGESNIVEMSGRGEVFWPQADRLTILIGGGDGSPEIAVKDADGK